MDSLLQSQLEVVDRVAQVVEKVDSIHHLVIRFKEMVVLLVDRQLVVEVEVLVVLVL